MLTVQELFDSDPFLHDNSAEKEEIEKPQLFAPIRNPASLCPALSASTNLMNYKKGTTTLGFIFQGGIILAVDSRASMGNFESSNDVRKVVHINDRVLGTLAGGAADCQFWLRVLQKDISVYELQNKMPISVLGVARKLANISYQYKNNGLQMGMKIAGWDDKGPQLYLTDSEGNFISANVISVGSGSTYAYGILDSYLRHNMSLDEAVELGVRAIATATHMDSGSGGVVRVYHITKNSYKCIHEGIDVNKLHYQFENQKGLVGDQDETNGKLV